MIQLWTLGGIGLNDEAGDDASSLLRQPKRFALLAYLALARPHGFHQRATLLALFWPELDDARARAALRQSLYVLRRALSTEVVANRGDEEVGCVEGALWCDARAFEDALEAGEPERALELYRGPLLDGFHVPDASSRFGYWLDDERERLRQEAVRAAWSAVAAAERRGDGQAARRYAARGVALAPLEEGPVRRQLMLLDRLGSRAEAIATFEQWASRLREELEVDPSPETLALVETLRAPRAAPEAEVAPGASAGAHGLVDRPATEALPPDAPAPPPGSLQRHSAARSVWQPRPGERKDAAVRARRRRRREVAALLAALLAILVTSIPLLRRESAGAEEPGISRVLVLPFTYQGAPSGGYLSEAMLYLLSVGLDGDDVRTISPVAVLREVENGAEDARDAASAAGVAERLNASAFVLGSVVESGGQLRIMATLHDGGTATIRGRAAASGPASDLPLLVDQVAVELLGAYRGIEMSRVTRVAGRTTLSLPALKAYLAGERRMREGRFGEAVDAFQEAVLHDPQFALAYYRMSAAAGWDFRGELSTHAAEQAVLHADRLPERDRRLLEAHAAYRRGAAVEARDRLEELTVLYPDDAEAWYRLAEVILHLGPLHGWTISAARPAFLEAAGLPSLESEAYYHVAQIDAAAGDTAAALDFIARARRAAPEGARSPQLRVLEALLAPHRGDWRAAVARLDGEDDFTLISSTYNAAVFAGHPGAARQIARLAAVPVRPPEMRVFGYALLAELELALGRPAAARAAIEAMARLDEERAAAMVALLAVAPGAEFTTAELEAALDRLRRGPGGVRTAPDRWYPEERMRAVASLFLQGLLHHRLGADGAVDGIVNRLEKPEVGEGVGRELALALRILAGDSAAAAGPPPTPAVSAEASVLSPVLSLPAARYAYALALARRGSLREALQWLEMLTAYSVHDLPWAVPALLERARIHEALGESAAAAACYRRFLELTEEGSAAGLMELRDRARSALSGPGG